MGFWLRSSFFFFFSFFFLLIGESNELVYHKICSFAQQNEAEGTEGV